MRDDLLQPSLSDDSLAKAPPTIQTMFLTSFFGGPVAAVLIAAVASYRLKRFARDLPVLLIFLTLSLSAIVWVNVSPDALAIRTWITTNVGSSGFTILYRLVGLACLAAVYLMHAKAHRNSQLLGLKPPNGWLVGLPCSIVGFLVMLLTLSYYVANAPKSSLLDT
jgi:hypothetical protein